MQDFEHAAELASAFHVRLHGIRFPLSATTASEIKDTVCAYTDELKRRGVPPERAIVAVKRAAREAGLSGTRATILNPLDLDGTDKLLADIVGWCIERYYGPPPRAD